MDNESKILNRAMESVVGTTFERDQLVDLVRQANLPSFFEKVDDSPYALEDWLRALAAFDGWLSGKGITARPAETMIGYLECCTLSVHGTLALPDFSELVLKNLEQYGFDAARPASTEPDDASDDS